MVGHIRWKAGQAFRSGLVAVAALIVTTAWNTAEAQPKKVVELFTSQGCSSCPPADRLAEDLVKNNSDDTLTVLMPVDYWDYLGWKDTLASPVHSQRQRAYANQRGDRSVYTPQMVINGEEHVVGSREGEVRAALARAQPFTSKVDLKITDMVVEAKVDGLLPEGAEMATVYFLKIQDEAMVDIGRGENAGRKIKYVNVVRNIQPLGMWSGGAETFRMPKSKLMLKGDARCAILVQVEGPDGPGEIIGAAVMDWNGGS